jgi:hypothetical protein
MDSLNKKRHIEKRGYERHSCVAIIEWSYFNNDMIYQARLFNFSEGGVYIETGHGLKPGVSIFLKMKTVSLGKANSVDHVCPRWVSLGEVKWCIDLSTSDQPHYGVGLEYPFIV